MASFRLTVIRAEPLLFFKEFSFSSPCLILKIQRNRNRTKGRGKTVNPNVHVKITAVFKCPMPRLRLQLKDQTGMGSLGLCEVLQEVQQLADWCTLFGRHSPYGASWFLCTQQHISGCVKRRVEKWSSLYTCLCPPMSHLSQFSKKPATVAPPGFL